VSNTATNSAAKGPARNDFEAFRIIAQRNIFNPNRSARGGSRNDSAESSKAVKTESFALVGTMLYADRELAFFDSSSASYRKVLKPGDSIAGYKVNEVAPNHVKLEANGKVVELSVGQQLKRENDGEWIVSGRSTSETASSSGASNTSSSSTSSEDEDEAVKRLMKKREEENNK